MGEKRMSLDYSDCVKRGKIKRYSRGRELVGKKIKDADEDLKDSQDSVKQEKYKWGTIQAYYSMFNTATALLYSKNLRENNSHSCLILAIRELFVSTGLIEASFVEALQEAKVLREAASYRGEWKKDNCIKLVTKAEEFLNRAREIIGEKK